MTRGAWLEAARGELLEVRAGWRDARHPRRTYPPTVAEARRCGTAPYIVGFVAAMIGGAS